jgi:excisionase family DNA binding protein
VLTTREVATRLGVGPGRVKQLVAQGRLMAWKFGHALAFDEAEVEEFALLERRPGHPPRLRDDTAPLPGGRS